MAELAKQRSYETITATRLLPQGWAGTPAGLHVGFSRKRHPGSLKHSHLKGD